MGDAPLNMEDDPSKKEKRSSSLVMSEYFQTMELFLNVQAEIMKTYLHNKKAYPTDAVDILSSEFPFIGSVVSIVPNQELVALREFNIEDDIFLRDHAFGGKISVDETLIPLPVIPMAVSVEIMAEAATLLQPDKLLIGVNSVSANKWIKVEGKPVTLQINARIQGENEVRVQIRNLEENIGIDPSSLSPVVEGTMVFGNTYPEPFPVDDFIMDGTPCLKTAQQLYEERLMFHGPCFQGVASLDRISHNGIEARIKTLRPDNFFQSNKSPRFITDCVTVDSVMQVFGYWAFEQLDTGNIALPIGLDALDIYRSNLPIGEQVKCQLIISEITSIYIKMDAYIFDTNGSLWMRVSGCKDWRFYASEKFVMFWRFPDKAILSEPYPAFASMSQEQPSFECYIIDIPLKKSDQFWIQTFSNQILNHKERLVYQNLKLQEDKKLEWLLGRIVAKDAVRAYMKRYGLELYPADIEITNDEYGCPVPCGYWAGDDKFTPALSLSHSNGVAVAIAGENKSYGIDIEKISEREQSFEKFAFTNDEQSLLNSASPSQRMELQTRFWCAKEAVAKALGCGFMESPLDFAVSDYKEIPSGSRIGIAKVTIRESLDEFLGRALNEIIVYISQYEDYIIAVTNLEAR